MTSFNDTFRGRSVLVTGHTGFKGAWLSLWLAELGAKVHGVALDSPTSPSLFDEANVRERVASHHVNDVRDFAALSKVFRETKPEVVFHLAAQALVRRSYREPRETYETNVMGTVNVLDAVRAQDGVRVCQIITSDKCYENREWVYPYRENEPMGGHDPYSNSKGCAELVVAAFRHSFFPPDQFSRHGVSVSSARAGNVIGGGDWAEDRIVPDCVHALSKGAPIPVRNPTAIRPWQHVLEPLSGYLHLAAMQWDRPQECADAWNFGPVAGGHLTVRQIVEQVIKVWGGGSWEAPDAPSADQPRSPSFHEATYLKLDITKAVSLLRWQPVYDVVGAIDQTITWYRRRHERKAEFRAAAECVEQIRAYTERAAHAGLAWAEPKEVH